MKQCVSPNGVVPWLVFLACLAPPRLIGQSKDRDHPTPVVSPEITGLIDKTVAGDRYFYLLTAGPGQLTFTFDVSAGRGMLTFATVNFDLYFMDGRNVINGILCNPSDGEDCRRTTTITLAKKQPLIVRISIDGQSSAGKFRVGISGPLELASGNRPPSGQGGKLRLEFADGTVQEIDMSRVRRLSWEQQ
jgi:hypothetical protein